jgi:beta-galactosidase
VDKTSIKNSWDDVVYVTATVTDENGLPCLNAINKIKFTVDGAGVIAAVDNADLASTESYGSKERWAYKGKCVAIIKASDNSGNIKITASAEELQSASISVEIH